MSKYRIVQIDGLIRKYYHVEKKKWWGWSTVQEDGVDMIGLYSYDKKFNSIKDAEDFILLNRGLNRKVIKTIEI